MKKILMINDSLSNGGSEHVMVMLANELAKRGYQVDMLLCHSVEKEVYIIDKKINLFRFEPGNIRGIRFTWEWFKYIRATLRKEKYHKVISFLRIHNILTLMAVKGTHNKVIVSERNNPFALKKDWVWLGEQLLYPSANKVVFQTQEIQKKYKNSIRKKSIVIANPVNPDIKSIEDYDQVKKIVIAVGRLHKQKNYPLLLNAFSVFVKDYPEYSLFICGKGELEQELVELCRKLKIEKNVVFKGFVQNVNDLMRQSSMFVISSDYEGISNSMIEALAIGVPTIATDCPVGGARMMIESGRNGILVPVGNQDALIEAMCSMASNMEGAIKMGKEAQKIKEEYSIEKIVDKWEKIID